jgi:arylsulfatase A-like enzyme
MSEQKNTITRRLALQQGIAAFFAMQLHASKRQTAPTAKPNVLFIAVDDLRPELSCYGRSWIKSPNIEALARRGMVFDHAYCQQAVCSPSRSSLMTGTRPDTTKVWDLVTHFRTALPNVETLPEHFKNNGYFVQGMGKIYHPSVEDPQTWSVPWQSPEAPMYSSKYKPDGRQVDDDIPLGKHKNGPAFENADVADDYFKDGKVANLAVKTLEDLSKKPEPFFLAVGFSKPHLPFVAPKKYWDMYDPATIKLAPNPFHPHDAPEYSVNTTGELRQYLNIPLKGAFSDDLARELKHGYYAAVSYTDAQIGKVINQLDKLGLDKNTIIVLWGDHGWKLGEHGEWTKHSNVENDTNAPLILSVPGMRNAGQHCDALVEFVDIYPTLCQLAGLSLPSYLEGVSFKPLLNHPDRTWKTAAFSQYPRKPKGKDLMGYTMRTKQYRFTIWLDREDHSKVDAIEVYDQKADPQENWNIAVRPENAELVKRLTEQWKQGWRAAKPVM